MCVDFLFLSEGQQPLFLCYQFHEELRLPTDHEDLSLSFDIAHTS